MDKKFTTDEVLEEIRKAKKARFQKSLIECPHEVLKLYECEVGIINEFEKMTPEGQKEFLEIMNNPSTSSSIWDTYSPMEQVALIFLRFIFGIPLLIFLIGIVVLICSSIFSLL